MYRITFKLLSSKNAYEVMKINTDYKHEIEKFRLLFVKIHGSWCSSFK